MPAYLNVSILQTNILSDLLVISLLSFFVGFHLTFKVIMHFKKRRM